MAEESVLANKNTLIMENIATEGDKDKERRPLGEIEFQVSQVIERLEAGAGLGERSPMALRKQSTGFLGPEETPLEDIIKTIEDLIFRSDPNDEDVAWPLPTLNHIAKISVMSHSIAAYAGSLERSHLQKLSARINTDTTRWLSHLFRFVDCNACYHHDQLEGLVKVTRLMLHYKYPRYLEEGGGALLSQLPCIYSSVTSPLGVVQHLCRQLGLPLACIRPVLVNTVFGSNQTMDVSALQRMIAEDVAASRIPLMVLADAGTTIVGHCDNISRLHDLCRLHDCWLHLRGNTLAALAITNGNTTIPPRISDSVTLPLGTWLGIPGLPNVTLYRLLDSGAGARGREGALPLLAGLTSDHSARRLGALPLWTALKSAGRDAMVTRITAAFNSVWLVWNEVAKMPCIRILSKQPGGEGGAYSITDLTTKPLNTTTIFEVAVSCVVFQFIPQVPEGTVLGRVPAYYDKLNSWLGQILQRDTDQIMIEICESETYGVVLRYCPLEAPADVWAQEERAAMSERLEGLSLCLEQQLDILMATVAHKDTFQRLLEASPTLRLVEMPGWAGLGGVRYVPEGWEALLTEQTKEELNSLNMSLVESLRATDAAFSLGEGTDGMACVRFGMVTADTDVEELLNLVVSVGKDFEENSKVLESMTEIVKKGIQAATLDLQRETSERLWQEGLLRHVPVVGRVVDWWSPPAATGVKGRSLNLRQGTIESTENIYKYHMQIPSGTIPHGVSKAPPPAMVQTPIGEGVKLPESMDHTHSRNSSHSSTATAPPAPNSTATMGNSTAAIASSAATLGNSTAAVGNSTAATSNSKAALGKVISAVAVEDPKMAGKT